MSISGEDYHLVGTVQNQNKPNLKGEGNDIARHVPGRPSVRPSRKNAYGSGYLPRPFSFFLFLFLFLFFLFLSFFLSLFLSFFPSAPLPFFPAFFLCDYALIRCCTRTGLHECAADERGAETVPDGRCIVGGFNRHRGCLSIAVGVCSAFRSVEPVGHDQLGPSIKQSYSVLLYQYMSTCFATRL